MRLALVLAGLGSVAFVVSALAAIPQLGDATARIGGSRRRRDGSAQRRSNSNRRYGGSAAGRGVVLRWRWRGGAARRLAAHLGLALRGAAAHLSSAVRCAWCVMQRGAARRGSWRLAARRRVETRRRTAPVLQLQRGGSALLGSAVRVEAARAVAWRLIVRLDGRLGGAGVLLLLFSLSLSF